MKKSYVIRVVNKKNGAHVYSHTDNVKKRLQMLTYNIESINGKGTAVFERFNVFKGCSIDDVRFEIYKQIA